MKRIRGDYVEEYDDQGNLISVRKIEIADLIDIIIEQIATRLEMDPQTGKFRKKG
jgi:hypothetical protein